MTQSGISLRFDDTVELFIARRVRDGASARTAVREARERGFRVGNDRARAIANLARNRTLTAAQRRAVAPSSARQVRVKLSELQGGGRIGANVAYTAVYTYAARFRRGGQVVSRGETVIKGQTFVASTQGSLQRAGAARVARDEGLDRAIRLVEQQQGADFVASALEIETTGVATEVTGVAIAAR